MTGLVWSLNRGFVRTFDLNVERQQAEVQVRALNQNLEHLVTDRTNKLRESEQLFLTLAEIAPVGIFRTDQSGHYLYVNARWCTIAGMGTDTAVAKGWTAALHPDDRERVAEEWAQAVRSQRPFLSEYRFQSAEQKIAWVTGQAQAELDHQGNMVGYRGTITDITDRKRMEEALRLAKFSIDRAADAVYWINPQAKILNVNEAASLMLGYSKDELCAMTVHDLNPDFQADMWPGFWAETTRRGTMVIESVHRAKNGRLIPIEVSVNYLFHEGKEYHCAFVRDITERKRVEDALRASEDRYRVLYDETPTMYFKLATDGTVLSANQFGAAQLGYRVEELVGHSVLDVFHEEDKEAVVAKLTECLATPEQTGHWEFRKVRKNGQTIWVHETVRVVRSSTEETVLLVSCEDITERKQVEAALQNFQDQIRQMQKMEAIGQLAGGVAHDFNNILTVILGNAELAYSTIASDHPSRANLTMILDAGYRASRLVRQILTFSHYQAFSRTVIALSPVMDEVLAMLRATLPASVELTYSCDPATPPVLADATQIHQVVMNLCTNAWHALEGKQGLIAVGLAPVTLTQPLQTSYTTLPPGHYACLSVRDTGCGMDSDTVTRIFDPFFTTKPVGQGTGLGLSVALGIVKGHDGAIVVNSHPGQGTTFSLYCPAAEALAQTSLPLETAPVQVQRRRGHLL
jgi:PAS domain S-box-containing protein